MSAALAILMTQLSLTPQTLAFVPLQMPDGAQRWRFVTPWPLKNIGKDDAERVLRDFIAQKMAEAHWCPGGWAEETRTVAVGNVIVEGSCATSAR